MNLRAYQTKSIDLVRQEYASGKKKTCLVLPTGAGKSVIALAMMVAAFARGKKVVFVVRGVSLIDQISRRLFSEGLEHGVLQSSHWNFRPTHPVQIVSVDTAIARNIFPPADFLVIDECDQCTSEGYKKFIAQYPKAFILGITATPYSSKSLRHVADSVVVPITMTELIAQGYLVPFKYYAPSSPDLSDVKTSASTKDYVNSSLEAAMVSGSLTGNIIDHYRRLASDRPTLLFAVNIHHSKYLVDKFISAGIPAEHADANTPQEQRDEIFSRLKSGETKVVSNVGIATRGFDAPFISCLILARPTKSLNLHIQMLGRGTRPSDGKTSNLILDHAGNLLRHGLPTDDREISLDGKDKNTVKKYKTCKQCFCVYIGSPCPECGAVSPVQDRESMELAESEEQLKEIIEFGNPVERIYKNLLQEAKRRGYKSQWAGHKLVERVGLEAAKSVLPASFLTYSFSKYQGVSK